MDSNPDLGPHSQQIAICNPDLVPEKWLKTPQCPDENV